MGAAPSRGHLAAARCNRNVRSANLLMDIAGNAPLQFPTDKDAAPPRMKLPARPWAPFYCWRIRVSCSWRSWPWDQRLRRGALPAM